ncbi:hypothetical protein Sya03_27520 [Spirilliplanes yamanashiensis]|uniref:Uncharacterized protein n=1 Tax=Spirilliplanes yamanashiensis TaxID=42233 RepID=A0A8J3Y8Z1_9ACTN|nr:hypothetical protein Sya03_27520 [Spirilliplanes yamanashiensis]
MRGTKKPLTQEGIAVPGLSTAPQHGHVRSRNALAMRAVYRCPHAVADRYRPWWSVACPFYPAHPPLDRLGDTPAPG